MIENIKRFSAELQVRAFRNIELLFHREVEVRDPVWPFAKVCLISALPFGVLAWFDKPWRSSDAAPVAVVAWTAVFGVFSLKYPGQCPFSAFLLFVPLVFSALVGHTVGTLLPTRRATPLPD